jgi:hypothetical protein
MSIEMAHKVIVPQKKIMSCSFLNSGTFLVIGLQWALASKQPFVVGGCLLINFFLQRVCGETEGGS